QAGSPGGRTRIRAGAFRSDELAFVADFSDLRDCSGSWTDHAACRHPAVYRGAPGEVLFPATSRVGMAAVCAGGRRGIFVRDGTHRHAVHRDHISFESGDESAVL